jgi:hypothetical protein
MLEGVADVDWAELGAAEVPDLLRAIPDAATALDAWCVTGRPATTSALPPRTALA